MFGSHRQVSAVAASLLLLACSKNHSLTIKIITPPGMADPFLLASQVRVTIGDKQTSSPVAAGHFSTTLEIESPTEGQQTQLLVEALDGAGQVVGRGRTPPFGLSLSDAEVAVYVGKPGQVTGSDLKIPDDAMTSAQGRKDLAACALRGRRTSPVETGLGAIIVSGESEGVLLSTKAWVFKPATFQILDGGTISKGRRGAVVLPSADATLGQQALLVGGAGAGSELLTQAEKFDPAVSAIKDVWSLPSPEIGDIGKPGMYQPAWAELQDSVFLVAGGSTDPASDAPSGQAVIVKRFPAVSADMLARVGVSVVPPPGDRPTAMVVPRHRHTLTALSAATLAFGGLSLGDVTAKKPVAELFFPERNAFQALTFMAGEPTSRRGHVAAKLKNGLALIIGGYSEAASGMKTVLGSTLTVDITARTFVLTDGILKTPRWGSSLHESSGELVICGGYDQNGQVVGDCEFLSTENGQQSRPPSPLPMPRAEHLAIPLENDLTLLIGGVGSDRKSVAALDFYTTK